MRDFILDYIAKLGLSASSISEEELLEAGIAVYLSENGISSNAKGAYYENYVLSHLGTIAPSDMKLYFINYSVMSSVRQIVIKYCHEGFLPTERRKELMDLMRKLHECGLGEKYLPKAEIRSILGDY